MDVIFRLQIFLAILPVLWGITYFLDSRYDLESRGIDLSFGTIMWRTEKGLGLLDRISKKFKRFWSAYGKLSAILGSVLMALFFASVFGGVVLRLMEYFSASGIPETPTSIKTRPIVIPGINTPLLLGLTSFAVILIIHEGAHGIILRKLGMKTKSAGLAVFLFIIPGAFVEQDDEEFENSSPWARMKVAGAGPITNVVGSIVALLLIILLVNPLSGIYITSVQSDSAADNAGITAGSKIVSIDGLRLENQDQFLDYMAETRPGETLELVTEENSYQVVLGDHPDENIGYLGVYSKMSQSSSSLITSFAKDPRLPLTMSLGIIIGTSAFIDSVTYSSVVPWAIIDLLKWIFALNLLVALINLLPLKPLDGGHIIKSISEKLTGSKEGGNTLSNLISLVSVTLIAFQIFLIYA